MGMGEVHELKLLDRQNLEIAGVERVTSFDTTLFELLTTAGPISIEGEDLHMKHYDMNAGIVRIQGKVNSMIYEDQKKRRQFAGRLLR